MQRCGVQMSWAVQGINNLSYSPLPPLPPSANASGKSLHIFKPSSCASLLQLLCMPEATPRAMSDLA